MMPKLDRTNLRKAIRHKELIWSLIKGERQVELAKKHILIHLKSLPKMKTDLDQLDSVDRVCKAIDLLRHSCYHTEYLYLVCRSFQPSKVVETGVHYGASSAFMLKALEEFGGHLYSIDLPSTTYTRDNGVIHSDNLPKDMQPGFVVPKDLRGNWKLILGDSREELPKLLESIGEIDLFHHDSMHTNDLMTFEYQNAWPHIKPGGLLLSDDANWNTAFNDFCRKNTSQYRIYNNIGVALKED
jgi:predicted O-methyltransferase YrrM